MFEISADTLLVRSKSLFASPVDDELVMMDEKRGVYFGLNAVASRIWDELSLPCTQAQMLEKLGEMYDVDLQTCEKEVSQFLQQLMQHDLIEVVPRS